MEKHLLGKISPLNDSQYFEGLVVGLWLEEYSNLRTQKNGGTIAAIA